MAIEAASSEDPDLKAIGDRMSKFWVQEKMALRNFWKEKEGRRKLRSGNVISVAKDSSKQQTAVYRRQLRHAFVESKKDQEHSQVQKQAKEQKDTQQDQQLNDDGLFNANGVNVSSRLMRARSTNMFRQSTLSEVHDLLSLNFIFTRAIIENCFQDDEESEIVARLLKADVPEILKQDINFFAEWAYAAASQEYLDFRRMLNGSSVASGGLAGSLLANYTTTDTLWQSRTQLARNEDTYIKRQRDQLPVPSGYEEVLLPDFYGEINQLCFAVMEVKKPKMSMADIEDDARKLPCMMKIALNMLIHANVQDPTVLGFLVSENICEVFSMNLVYEAIYIPKSLGRFKLPQDQLDIPALLPALGPLTAAKTIASTTIKSIKRRRSRSGKGKYSPLTRPSYYVYGSKVPTA
ncbi:hypothetical protein DFQ26_000649 [Actinomortierella ambigua]|nr:hypothetical protein DFQ26_000649 [Actinomortierella ambigua]